jgi:hypothetical protein
MKDGGALLPELRAVFAYFDRLDPITIAKMEREWGVEAKVLLEAARIAIVDDIIPLAE